jgi:hypothetical protein
MKVKYFLCADSASIDNRLTTLSLFHILDEAIAVSFPFVIPRIVIASSLIREERDQPDPRLQLKIQIGENVIAQAPFRVDFQENQNTSRSVAEMHNLLIVAPGTLKFILSMADENIAEWSMNIGQVGSQDMGLLFDPMQISRTGKTTQSTTPKTEAVEVKVGG